VNMKVRQPLSAIMVPVVDEDQRKAIESMAQLILSEINVKNFKFVGSGDGVLVKKVKPDFKKLGPKFGKQMKAVAAAIASLSQPQIVEFEKNGSIEIVLDGVPAVIDASDVEIFSEDIPGWLVANEGNVTIALDVTITDELKQEGIARDIVNRIQNIRKSRGYDITDRINLTFEHNPDADSAVTNFDDYIKGQVLANNVVLADNVDAADDETLDIDGLILKVKVEKV
ncbi:MAG: isoleucine--tRNA ligase, partial [Muribaculaceae bacterium]|nr:isoleucine--tRNA ligase [Muribaculaceae bacterium]